MSQKQNAGGPEKRAETLRHRAELAWHLGAVDLRRQATPDRAQRLVHELQVHQIELEMQNEELQRARHEAEAARNQYFDLYDLAPVGYLTLNEHGLIQRANLTLAALLGVERASLAGASLEHFIVAEDQDIYYLQRRRMDDTGARQVCELRMLRHGAPPFWANIETVLKAEPAGEPRAYWTTVSDVSERKQAEAALRASEEKYRIVGDYAYDWEAWRAPDGTYLYISPSCAADHRDTRRPQFLADPDLLRNITHPDDRPMVDAHWYAVTHAAAPKTRI